MACRGTGRVISNLGVFDFNGPEHQMRAVSLHPGVEPEQVREATSFEVHVDDAQPERTYSEIREILDASTLDAATKASAHATFLRLAKSEANVHKMPIDGVHFHEVGAIDSSITKRASSCRNATPPAPGSSRPHSEFTASLWKI